MSANISNHNSGIDTKNLPKIDMMMYYYLENIKQNVFPDHHNKYYVLFIRFLHFIGLAFIAIGWALPRKFLPFHMFLTITTLISWLILSDKCYMSIIVNKILNRKEYIPLVDSSPELSKFSLYFLTLLSMYSYFGSSTIFDKILNTFTYLKTFD